LLLGQKDTGVCGVLALVIEYDIHSNRHFVRCKFTSLGRKADILKFNGAWNIFYKVLFHFSFSFPFIANLPHTFSGIWQGDAVSAKVLHDVPP
jgi:hypothetical protein